jgi:AcrR family transcriptional regulator
MTKKKSPTRTTTTTKTRTATKSKNASTANELAMADGTPTDGRQQRAARNHAAIVEAVYVLVRETGEPPNIDAVAARAGVGVRTVFRQFADLETLHRSVNARLDGEVRALLELPTGAASGVEALIERRARVFEHIAPFRRASHVARPTSRFIVEQEALMAALLRAALQGIVDAEDEAFEALDLLLSWEAWERLRRTQHLSVIEAQRVVGSAARALLDGQRRRAR